ncbi:MAG: hypothetical protein ABGY11_16440 [Candidatus Thioglobus sp.]
MGWLSKTWKKVKKVVKAPVKSVTKHFKKITKKIGSLAKKVWKGVKQGVSKVWSATKKGVKKIGAAITKLGPLGQIAMMYFTAGLWATYGVWGAMAKGALMGYATGGTKGALLGAVGSGIGYGVSQGASAFKEGYGSLGETASFTDKLSAGFDSVGTSTVDGVTNMFDSASKFVETGSMDSFNYLDKSGNYIGQTQAAEIDVGTQVLDGAKTNHVNKTGDWSNMSKKSQLMMQENAQFGKVETMNMAEELGYSRDAGAKYYENAIKLPEDYSAIASDTRTTLIDRQLEEVGDYMGKTGTGLEQGKMLWEQTGGLKLDESFDWKLNDKTMQYDYTGEGVEHTAGSGMGGTPTYISPDKAPKPKIPSTPKTPSLAGSDTWANPFTPITSVPAIASAEGGLGQGQGYGSGAVDTYDITKLGLQKLSQQALLSKQQMGLV